jgi:hypothetical protein
MGSSLHKNIPAMVGFVVALAAGLLWVRMSAGPVAYRSVKQPVAFNHRIHAHHPQRPIECAGCHRGVKVSYHATLPGVSVCSSCHLEPKGKTEKERQFIAEYVDNEKPIGWNRLFVLPDHVFFSHRLHVVRGKVECQTCHGPMDQQTQPASHPLRVLRMQDCLNCHEARGVNRDCNTCHR